MPLALATHTNHDLGKSKYTARTFVVISTPYAFLNEKTGIGDAIALFVKKGIGWPIPL